MVTFTKLDKPRAVVFSKDPALDRPEAPPEDAAPEAVAAYQEAETAFQKRWNRYLETYDLADLPFREGMKPTVFYVGQLPLSAVEAVESAPSFGDKITESIAYGVVGLQDCELVDETGAVVKTINLTDEGRKVTPHGRRLPSDVLALFTDEQLRVELWGHVVLASRLARSASR